MDANDILGQQFGLLTVVSVSGYKNTPKGAAFYYLCQCKCGKSVEINRSNLKWHHTRSCGCLRRRAGEHNPGWKGAGKISGHFWASIRNHAKKRGLAFNITMQDAWTQYEKQGGLCAMTGWPLGIECSSKKRGNKTGSLDRIDSNKGYEVDNIQWVHKDVNQMKWSLSGERFIEICRATIAHLERTT